MTSPSLSSSSTPATTPTTPKPTSSVAPPLTLDKVEQKTKDLIDEFLHMADDKEALLCARELSSAAHAHVIVTTALNHVLERSEVAHKQTGALMHDLVKEKVVTIDDFKYVEDLEIDVPQVWTYLGQTLGPLVDVKDNDFPFANFKDVAAPLVKIRRGGKLMGAVLGEAKRLIGAGGNLGGIRRHVERFCRQ